MYYPTTGYLLSLIYGTKRGEKETKRGETLGGRDTYMKCLYGVRLLCVAPLPTPIAMQNVETICYKPCMVYNLYGHAIQSIPNFKISRGLLLSTEHIGGTIYDYNLGKYLSDWSVL